MSRHGDLTAGRLDLNHDSGWGSLSHDTGERPHSSGEVSMYGIDDIYNAHDDSFDLDDADDVFGEIGEAVGDDMFGARGRARARARGRSRRPARRATQRGRQQGRKQGRKQMRRKKRRRTSQGRAPAVTSQESEYWQMVGGSPAWQAGLVPGQEAGGGYADEGYDDQGYYEEEEEGELEALADELLMDEGYEDYGYHQGHPHRSSGSEYGHYRYGDAAPIVVHEPPSGTFSESLQTGFGVGLGVVGAFTLASLVSRAFR